MKYTPLFALLILLIYSCQPSASQQEAEAETTAALVRLHYEQEKHLATIKQLTSGGAYEQAYFNADNTMLLFQATNENWDAQCNQTYYMSINGYQDRPPLLSTGKGRTTSAFFLPRGTGIIYASTHLESENCPSSLRAVNGEAVWPIYPSLDIFSADLQGNISKQLTNESGYDAEASVSPDGQRIVFTSTRSGDPELYTMNVDGSNVQQITNQLGYDGGAFFSPDSQQLVFCASRPKTKEELSTYQALLAMDLVASAAIELFICNADGSDMRQLTELGGTNQTPYFHPSGEKIIFTSNHHTKDRIFNLFMINTDGTGLEQITFDDTFDAFPMFSHDGKKLVFSSYRNNGGTREANIFIADWIE
ncbi:MAG: hypothetical protein AAF798_13960 [Bacteroidota bacterium]